MSSSTASQGLSIFQHLRAIKEIIQDAIFDAKIATSPEKAEFDALEQDVFEVLRLIRSWRNTIAPINKIPPEILVLVPDFLDPFYRNRGVIGLTHVCRAWREMFVSRSSLWTDFDCKDGDKTQVYLKRSKSSPINLVLDRPGAIFYRDPFFRFISRIIGRLGFLSIRATPEDIEIFTPYLSYPVPLLEHLTINGGCEESGDYSVLPSALFNGDLSSLRTLDLESVITKLPWRNMVNLTSFSLAFTLLEGESIKQLLEFFEGAPRLCEVTLHHITLTTGAENGRLVPLVCLKSMRITGDSSSSVLLDHLVIPVGAKLEIRAVIHDSLIGEHLPRSLGNLKNLSNVTTIHSCLDEYHLCMEFSGPNGEVALNLGTSRLDRTGLVLESLAQLDTSKTEWLEIDHTTPLSRDSLYQTLLLMENLRTLTLSIYKRPLTFIHALDSITSSPEAMVCPKLEELVLVFLADGDADKLDITSVIEMAAARASGGKKLRTVRIVDERDDDPDTEDVFELKKHVWNVEMQSTAYSDEED